MSTTATGVPLAARSLGSIRSALSLGARLGALPMVKVYQAVVGAEIGGYGAYPFNQFASRDAALSAAVTALSQVDLTQDTNPVPSDASVTWLNWNQYYGPPIPNWQFYIIYYAKVQDYNTGTTTNRWLGGTPLASNFYPNSAVGYAHFEDFSPRLWPLVAGGEQVAGFWSGLLDDWYGGGPWITGAITRIDNLPSLYNARNSGTAIVSSGPYTIRRSVQSVTQVYANTRGRIIFPSSGISSFLPINPNNAVPPMQIGWDAEYHWVVSPCVDAYQSPAPIDFNTTTIDSDPNPIDQ